MKKAFAATLLALVLSITCCFGNYGNVVSAQSSNSTIPEKMNPGTVIEYDSTNNMKIVVNGFQFNSNNKEKLIHKKSSVSLPSNAIVTNFENEPVYLPSPVPGMRVSYDGNGNPAIIKGDPNLSKNINNNYIKNNVVASSNNSISSTSGSIIGDFSYFTDPTGDYGHVLQNYDCATKIGFDNPPSGTTIYAYALDDEISTILYKWDSGTLPKAILDVRPYVFTQVFGHPLSDGLIYGYYFY